MAIYSREMQAVVPLTRTLEKLLEQTVRTIETLQFEFDGVIHPSRLDPKQAGLYLLLLMYDNQLDFLQHMLAAERGGLGTQGRVQKRIEQLSSAKLDRFPYRED